jgi:hypothetical protein
MQIGELNEDHGTLPDTAPLSRAETGELDLGSFCQHFDPMIHMQAL